MDVGTYKFSSIDSTSLETIWTLFRKRIKLLIWPINLNSGIYHKDMYFLMFTAAHTITKCGNSPCALSYIWGTIYSTRDWAAASNLTPITSIHQTLIFTLRISLLDFLSRPKSVFEFSTFKSLHILLYYWHYFSSKMFFFWNHTLCNSGLTPISLLSNHSCEGSENHMGFWVSNLDYFYAILVLLTGISLPSHLIFFLDLLFKLRFYIVDVATCLWDVNIYALNILSYCNSITTEWPTTLYHI